MSDAERLREIQSELAEVLEARLGDLEELAKQTGSMSHTLLAVDVRREQRIEVLTLAHHIVFSDRKSVV